MVTAMTTAPFQGHSFQSAAFRRKGKPLIATLEHVRWDDEGNELPMTITLRIDPLVDAVRLGAVLGPVGATLSRIGAEDTPVEDKLTLMQTEQPHIANAIRDLLVPTCRADWDDVKGEIDLATMAQIVSWVTREMSGLDPTQRPLSSDGSEPTTSTSTDGAAPEA